MFMALFLSIFIVPSSDMDVQIKAEPGILVPDEKYLVAKCNFNNIQKALWLIPVCKIKTWVVRMEIMFIK